MNRDCLAAGAAVTAFPEGFVVRHASVVDTGLKPARRPAGMATT